MVEALLPSPAKPLLMRSDSFDFLCACANANASTKQASCIAHFGDFGLDWSTFLHLAEHHGVLPLVARNLACHARDLPTETAHVLQAAYEANLRRSLWFVSELSRVYEHFQERQLPAIAYKGPVLAESVYGDIGLRSFSDLDLLISPADFTRARLALAEIGYRPSQEFPSAVERFFLRTGYERSFDSATGKNLLELQWSLLPYFYAVDFESAEFSVDHLLKRAKELEVCGRRVLCLAPEDSLLALCLHAAKHLWTRLIWVADIAHMLSSQTIDMRPVVARACALGLKRIVAVSLWLSNRLLGAVMPAEGQALIDRDAQVAECGERCVSRMSGAATYNLESGAYFKEIASLRERPADRWRYLWRLVWTPGAADIAAVNLPESLFPLYHGVRAARLLRKLA